MMEECKNCGTPLQTEGITAAEIQHTVWKDAPSINEIRGSMGCSVDKVRKLLDNNKIKY